MKKLWLLLVPDLTRIHAARRKNAIEKASKSELQAGELGIIAVWLVVVGLVTRSILQGATDDNRITFTIVANLIFTAPALLLVFIPIHIRRVRRDIKRQLSE
ncbi:hypothetical protein [Rhodoferax sp. BLA1]|uniref:hypothetical protein n=1 Tax=Rhodoferax sp. BLA1 TaxID=2576062 RepID=UPI0015D27DEC|nr:hypothetical protein [Rhodoferax sp. BLA1]